jgi:hypothetical protein
MVLIVLLMVHCIANSGLNIAKKRCRGTHGKLLISPRSVPLCFGQINHRTNAIFLKHPYGSTADFSTSIEPLPRYTNELLDVLNQCSDAGRFAPWKIGLPDCLTSCRSAGCMVRFERETN